MGPTVNFPNPNLEAAVREVIKIPSGPIDKSSLARVTVLQVTNEGIDKINGLEQCSNLRFLNLGSNRITDISPLADLMNLKVLQLDSNRITDISPLANLTGLTSLLITNNQITDITPLANLTNLTMLWLNNNRVTDILPLVDNRGFGKEDKIYIQGNPLNGASCYGYIPMLKGRGVIVEHDSL